MDASPRSGPSFLSAVADRFGLCSQCGRAEAQIARALYGNWRAEHMFALQQAVTLYNCFREQLQVCDERLHADLGTFTDQSEGCPP